MTQIMNKKDSIYAQLLSLLLVAAFVACVVFCGLKYAGEYLVDVYLEKTDYIEQKNQNYVNKLQKYIDKEQLSSRDAEKLSAWTKDQKVLYVYIFKDDIQVFNSEYPEQEVWAEEITAGNYAWEHYYDIQFSDGAAEITLTGIYHYQFYSYALITEIILVFLLFLIIVLSGIRKKIEYICKLSEEIQILEGGGLDYAITVKGKDELAKLAESLDTMRLSFGNLIDQEKKMVQENQRIVTEMSHDLRTPITAIMLYTEILKKGTYKNAEQEKKYIEKIDEKARRMKQLTDHLFEYSLIAGEVKVKLEDAESYEVLFYNLFSDACSYLEQKGFRSEFHVQWVDQMIQISTEYIMRIMDNITSNIIKYADSSMPILISSIVEGQMAGFIFENHIRTVSEKVDSTEIGIQSIKVMMSKMNGKCKIEQENGIFRIILLFPVVEAELTD